MSKRCIQWETLWQFHVIASSLYPGPSINANQNGARRNDIGSDTTAKRRETGAWDCQNSVFTFLFFSSPCRKHMNLPDSQSLYATHWSFFTSSSSKYFKEHPILPARAIGNWTLKWTLKSKCWSETTPFMQLNDGRRITLNRDSLWCHHSWNRLDAIHLGWVIALVSVHPLHLKV
jgi:hypothetical protein